MYKTVRHGENSLQYTILPQSDTDYNGKLSIASGTKSGIKNKHRGKKKSIFAYFGLLFVCTVIIGAILIPFLVSTQCLTNPTSWFITTQDSSKQINNTVIKDRFAKKDLIAQRAQTGTAANLAVRNQILYAAEKTNSKNSTVRYLNQNVTTDEAASYPKNRFEYEEFSAENSKIGGKNNSRSESVAKRIQLQNKSSIRPYKRVLSNEISRIDNYNTYNSASNESFANILRTKLKPHNSSNLIETQLNAKKVDTLKEALTSLSFNNKVAAQTNVEVPPKIGIDKKPVILPVLAKTNLIIKENGKVLTNAQNNTNNWLKSHWPYIDLSKYTQWDNYNTELKDDMFVVIYLVLLCILLTCLIWFMIRKRKTFCMKSRSRTGIVKIQETGDDNATLLTSSLSDDE